MALAGEPFASRGEAGAAGAAGRPRVFKVIPGGGAIGRPTRRWGCRDSWYPESRWGSLLHLFGPYMDPASMAMLKAAFLSSDMSGAHRIEGGAGNLRAGNTRAIGPR